MRAYDVQLDQIAGPAWIMDNMGPNLYQIDAAIPAGTTKAQFQQMMRTLLAERFHLAFHREKRNFPGYDLVVARGGPKLNQPASGSNSALPPGPQMRTSLGRGMIRVELQEKPLSDLVAGLGRLIAQSQGGDPADFASRKARVIDKTGLTGTYSFTLEFSCEGCRSLGANGSTTPADPAGSGLPDIFAALEKQLGLRLVKTKDIPLDVIVVDHADKIPTGN